MRLNNSNLDRTTIHNNIIININNGQNGQPGGRKSPSMQSERGNNSSRVKDMQHFQV